MKKIVYALCFCISFATNCMLPQEFLNRGTSIFISGLTGVRDAVVNNRDVDEIIGDSVNQHHDWLNNFMEIVNQKANEQLVNKLREANEKFQQDLNVLKTTNTRLSSQLDSMLRSKFLTKDFETLYGSFQDRNKQIDQIIDDINLQISTVTTSPFCTKDQIDRIIDDIKYQLTDLKEDLSMNTYNQTNSMMDMFEVLLGRAKRSNDRKLQTELARISALLQERYQAKEATMIKQFDVVKQLYEAQISDCQKLLDDALKAKVAAEKKAELRSRLNQIFISNGLKAEKIIIRAIDCEHMTDVLQRYETVKSLFDTFKFFSSLYGNRDLMIECSKLDLDAVNNWLTKLNISNVLKYYGTFNFPQEKAPIQHSQHATQNIGFDAETIAKPLFDARAKLQEELDSY